MIKIIQSFKFVDLNHSSQIFFVSQITFEIHLLFKIILKSFFFIGNFQLFFSYTCVRSFSSISLLYFHFSTFMTRFQILERWKYVSGVEELSPGITLPCIAVGWRKEAREEIKRRIHLRGDKNVFKSKWNQIRKSSLGR